MVNITNPHDKYFRASMQEAAVYQPFFQQYLPKSLLSVMDVTQFKLGDSSYIDEDLQATFSDLVYSCRYGEQASSQAKMILLVEHQSTPDKLMPFRVYHYLFNMLYKDLKGRPTSKAKDKLPVVYALVFYHGKQTPYPYSLKLADCFDDPLNMMRKFFEEPVPLIDINQIGDDELKQQQLLGDTQVTSKWGFRASEQFLFKAH